MKLSEQTRKNIILHSTIGPSLVGGSIIPLLMVHRSTGNFMWLLFLPLIAWSSTSVFLSLRSRAIRAEIPDYPIKASQYLPAQKNWLREYKRNTPKIEIVKAMAFFTVMFAPMVMLDSLIGSLATSPMEIRIVGTIAGSAAGVLWGVIFGRYAGIKTIEFIEALTLQAG